MMKMEAENENRILESHLLTLLPVRQAEAHKGTFGSVAVIGGQQGMVGAALLAGRAALHSGAGRIYVALLSQSGLEIDLLQPEIMFREVEAISQLSQLNSIVIGPGLGQSTQAIQLLEHWIAQDKHLLLDADALNLIANHQHLASQLKHRAAQTVITPHPGEAARLLKTHSESIQKNRIESALALAINLQVTCVLKGAGTLCADQNGHYEMNTTGNVGLASGGTGDVLSGIIGGFLGQGIMPFAAAKLGVYVHGAAADTLVERGVGPLGLTASEVLLAARDVLNHLYRKANVQ
jgi:ADP-dependent NAD(P)H-hydrate dehydratase / NAD(P)H-hydrate epimerase